MTDEAAKLARLPRNILIILKALTNPPIGWLDLPETKAMLLKVEATIHDPEGLTLWRQKIEEIRIRTTPTQEA